MKLFIMYFSSPRRFFSLTHKRSPQHLVLKYHQSLFFSQSQTKFRTHIKLVKLQFCMFHSSDFQTEQTTIKDSALNGCRHYRI